MDFRAGLFFAAGEEAGAAQKGRDVDSAVTHEVHGVDQVPGRPILQQVGIGPGGERIHDERLVAADGEDQELGGGAGSAELRTASMPVTPGMWTSRMAKSGF